MKYFFSGLLFIQIYICTGQYFEGKIIYKNTFISKIDGVSAKDLANSIGDSVVFYYKADKYKSKFNGSLIEYQLYSPMETRIYTKMSISDTLYWNDASQNDEPVIELEFMDNEVTILGEICEILFIRSANTKYTYYYPRNSLFVNDVGFKNHAYSNWTLFIATSKALPLKTMVEFKEYTRITEALQIVPMKIDDSFFNIPDSPRAKSPF